MGGVLNVRGLRVDDRLGHGRILSEIERFDCGCYALGDCCGDPRALLGGLLGNALLSVGLGLRRALDRRLDVGLDRFDAAADLRGVDAGAHGGAKFDAELAQLAVQVGD
ncbi:hypothetical protein WL27_05340 [Burkholderia multivorans]|nr:hypothetical protein WL27_05340 [Burkholderia multivorans]